MTNDRIDFEQLLGTLEKPEQFERMARHIIAINVAWSLHTNQTLYEAVLQRRVADAVWALDDHLANQNLGVITIPPSDLPDYLRVRAAIEPLRQMPRGAWAVFDLDGKYDAYMADGVGGLATETGNKFYYVRPTAPNLNFLTQYGALLGWSAYHLRKEVEKEIFALSIEKAGIKAGTTVTDRYINSKKYDKIIADADVVDGTMTVTASRRGTRKVQFKLDAELIFSYFGDYIKIAIPDKYLISPAMSGQSTGQGQDHYWAEIVPGRFAEFKATELDPAMVESWNVAHGIVPSAGHEQEEEGVTTIIIKLGSRRQNDPTPAPNRMSAYEMEIAAREIVSRQMQASPDYSGEVPGAEITQKVLTEFGKTGAFQGEMDLHTANMLDWSRRLMQQTGGPLRPIEIGQAPQDDLPSPF